MDFSAAESFTMTQPLRAGPENQELSPSPAQLCYLVDEGGKAVVEALNLLLLVSSAHGKVWIDLKVERSQQTLVDRQRGQWRC